MKLSIVGGRDFTDYGRLLSFINKNLNMDNITHIISGGARGADSLASRVAEDFNKEMVVYKPDWKQYGRGAGIVRNTLIIQNSDIVAACWNGVSKGTKDSINKSNKYNKELYVLRY